MKMSGGASSSTATSSSSTDDMEEGELAALDRLHDERLYHHGLGDSALGGLPQWMKRYASLCLRYVEHEKRELPPLLRRAVFLRKQQLAESAIEAGASKSKAIKAAAKAAASQVTSGSHSKTSGEQLKKEFAKHGTLSAEDEETRRENMVGKKIKIFWPTDKTFYVAHVASYDPDEQKHTVKYELDGVT